MQDDREGLGSGSGYARDKHCAANRKMANRAKELGKLPEVEPEAEKGRDIHLWLNPNTRGSVTLSEESLEAADEILLKAGKLLPEWRAGRQQGVVYFEKRFWLYKGVQPIRTSQPDYVEVIVEHDGLDILIVDYKTGFLQVGGDESSGPSQLEEYALTAAVNLSGPKGIKRVKCYLVSRWKSTFEMEFYGADLVRIYRELLLTISAGNAEHPQQIPGWYCLGCAGRLICPSATQEITLVDQKPLSDPLPEGEEGEKFIDVVRRVKSLSEQILNHYKKRLTDSPGCCRSYIIGEGDKTRKITDIGEAYGLLVTDGKISQQEFMECCELHIAKLEKYYCNKAGKPQRQAKKEFNQLLASVIKEGQKAGSLEKVRELI